MQTPRFWNDTDMMRTEDASFSTHPLEIVYHPLAIGLRVSLDMSWTVNWVRTASATDA
jgi:hypothetical protein